MDGEWYNFLEMIEQELNRRIEKAIKKDKLDELIDINIDNLQMLTLIKKYNHNFNTEQIDKIDNAIVALKLMGV